MSVFVFSNLAGRLKDGGQILASERRSWATPDGGFGAGRLWRGPCNRQFVLDEFLKLLGCETSDGKIHDSATTAKQWAALLHEMAIEMTVGSGHSGHMAIDAV